MPDLPADALRRLAAKCQELALWVSSGADREALLTLAARYIADAVKLERSDPQEP